MATKTLPGPMGPLVVNSSFSLTRRLVMNDPAQVIQLEASDFGLSVFPMRKYGVKFFAAGGGTESSPCGLECDPYGYPAFLYNIYKKTQGYFEMSPSTIDQSFLRLTFLNGSWNNLQTFTMVQIGFTPESFVF